MSEIRFDDQIAVISGAGVAWAVSMPCSWPPGGTLVVVNDIGGALDGTGSSDDPASLVVKEADAGGITVADSHNITTSPSLKVGRP